MKRGTRTAIKLITIIVVTMICTTLAYYSSSYAAGHGLATASGGMNYSRWQEKFFILTAVTGALSGICTSIWFILTRMVFEINSPQGVGRRLIWSIIALISIIICIAVPHLYSASLGIKVNGIVIGLFIIFFTVLNYWLLSIFTTPLSFKYTPVGAQIFLSRK